MLSAVALMAMAEGAWAQDVKGRVVNSLGEPVTDVVITCPGHSPVRTDASGSFTFKNLKGGSVLKFTHDGYYVATEYVRKAQDQTVSVHLIETANTRYNETSVRKDQTLEGDKWVAGVENVNRKDFALGSLSADRALKGAVTGLNVVNKSGMTGEGAYLQLRGVHSFIADNAPLIVVNGVPYMPDMNESQAVAGYSRSVFQALNGQDIRNITVLKGADAAVYGSMGSNGVIMIETDQATSDNMNTRIAFNAVYGVNWNSQRIPLMQQTAYKSYLSDIGLTYYPNMEAFFNDFTFLTNPQAVNANLYQFNTNWQDQLFRTSSTMDYLFRVEGGDAIAKYNISLGYLGDGGTLKDTHSDRYNAQINASVLVSKKIEIQAAINAAYMTGKYQEQGLSYETNPMLAAYRRSPLLSPYASDMYGNVIGSLSSYKYGAIDNSNFYVSNPLALVNTLDAKTRQYDLNAKLQFIYTPMTNLTLAATVGLYYNYNQEETFIPGVTDGAIVPLFDQYGEAQNTVRVGTNHSFNMYYGVSGNYKLSLSEKNKMDFRLGMQALTTNNEYDAAFGRNTNNDFYQTMGDVQKLGRYFDGYNNKWNWMNVYAHVDYTFNNLVRLGATASYDGASSIGEDATRMSVYPAVEAVFMAKELDALKGVDFLNKLNVYANYSITGNSRFANKIGKYYYTSQPYQTIAGIVRANLPNTELKAERDNTLNVGVETAMWNNRLMLNLGYYNIQANDVLMVGNTTPVLGTSNYYCNDAKLSSSGLEASVAVMPVMTRDFKWTIGGNITTLKNKVEGLGNVADVISTLNDDATLITRVGENPYAFYGLQTNGVFSTVAEATAAGLVNRNGDAYQAGDVRFVDQNGDNVIDDKDRVVIGSATPDFFGSFFTRLEYKGFALDATFAYSVGNDAYNAVRRITESGKDFSNQSTSLERRWSMEGQVTDIPRVSYNDNIGNNVFSDRWIEDASYLKLRDVTLSYTYNRPIWNFFQGITVYVTGQNLVTFTKYLGLDPEFSYSNSSLMQGVDYAKVNAPRAVKFGVNLKF